MANTFDEIFDGVKDIASKAGKKTSEIVDISKTKLEIVSINSDIRKSFEKLGSLVYNSKKKDCENDDIVKSCIEEIDALYTRLDECKTKIDAAKNVIRCPECGTANNIIAAYCYACGTKLAKEQPEEEKAEEEPAKEEKTVGEVFEKVTETVAETVERTFGDAKEKAKEILEDLRGEKDVEEKVEDAVDSVKDAVEDVKDAAEGAVEDAAEAIKEEKAE